MMAVSVGHYFPCDSCDISSKWVIISASGRFFSTVISTHIKVLNFIMQKFILPTFFLLSLVIFNKFHRSEKSPAVKAFACDFLQSQCAKNMHVWKLVLCDVTNPAVLFFSTQNCFV